LSGLARKCHAAVWLYGVAQQGPPGACGDRPADDRAV